jgi:outer membrane protein assembly factor BamA
VGAAFVTFPIDQGPRYHVRAVTVSGVPAKETGVVTLGQGDVYDADRIARAGSALAERLAARGRQATVSAKLHRDDAAALVDVELAVR